MIEGKRWQPAINLKKLETPRSSVIQKENGNFGSLTKYEGRQKFSNEDDSPQTTNIERILNKLKLRIIHVVLKCNTYFT